MVQVVDILIWPGLDDMLRLENYKWREIHRIEFALASRAEFESIISLKVWCQSISLFQGRCKW